MLCNAVTPLESLRNGILDRSASDLSFEALSGLTRNDIVQLTLCTTIAWKGS